MRRLETRDLGKKFLQSEQILLMALAGAMLLGAFSRFASAQPVEVRVSYSSISAGQGSIWIPQEEGLFAKEGLNVKLLYIRSGSTSAQALVSNEVQFGHFSAIAALQAWSQGIDLVWLGTTTNSLVFTLLTHPSIRAPQDLRGKTVGTTRPGSAADFSARIALKSMNVDFASVKFLSLGELPAILASLEAGIVQAAALPPPFSTMARKKGFHPMVFIPNLKEKFTLAGIVGMRIFVENNPRVCRPFMKAVTEGAAVYKNNPEVSLRVLLRYMKTDDLDMIREGYREYEDAISSPPVPDFRGLESVKEALAAGSPKIRKMKLQDFVDGSCLRAAGR